MDSDLSLLSFVAASLVVLIIPGPGVMYVVARSLSQGYSAGFVSALGLSSGVVVHVVAASIGLSTVLLASASAFTIVKLLGAVYLIYLGIQFIGSAGTLNKPQALMYQPLHRLFVDGVIVSVLNPKIAIFFLAFLPQFVKPEAGSTTWQVVSYGLLYAALALITDSTYAIVSVKLKNTAGFTSCRGPVLQYIAGGLLIGLGLRAALTAQR